MRHTIVIGFGLFSLVALIGFWQTARAQDEGTDGFWGKVTGEVSATGQWGSGQKDSAKFDEYKDTPNGGTGDIRLNYRDKETDSYFSLESTDIALRDQRTEIEGGQYGSYRMFLQYDQLPHWYARGNALTLYSGTGSDTLVLPDRLQGELQSASSLRDAGSILTNEFQSGARYYNVRTMRRKETAKVEYLDLKPFTILAEGSSEQRTGERPILGSFGFGNVQELTAPVDYWTTNARLTGQYLSKDYLITLGYTLSVFHNDNAGLTWDNPFRLTDSTGAAAYTNPVFVSTTRTFINNGSSRGRMALEPDNVYHGPSLTASAMNLPWKSRITFNTSLNWMGQDDSFLPYTANTSIFGSDLAGGVFPAFDTSGLPADNPDASVATQLYNLVVTSRPLADVDLKAKYKYYDYHNNSDQLIFPGTVIFDGVFEEGPVRNRTASYTKQSAGADAGYRIREDTRLELGYQWDGMQRSKREVADQNDNTISASVENRFADWINVRTSYQKIFRRIDEYDPEGPFPEDELFTNLPFLRKYDEASKDTDQLHFLGTLLPTDKLSLTGSLIYGQSEYGESAFGLLSDRFYTLSGDADYAFSSWLKAGAFYSYEQHNSRQKDRQWVPGGLGDPLTEPGLNSFSNWDASNEDVVHTVGGQFIITALPKTLFVELNYTYSDAYGNVDFSSPLGTVLDDANPFVPTPYNMVDRTILQRINPRLRYRISKNWEAVAGYLWEKFQYNDFEGSGFMNVPLKTNGDFNGAMLSGYWPWPDYEVNLGYVTVKYRF